MALLNLSSWLSLLVLTMLVALWAGGKFVFYEIRKNHKECNN